MLGSPPTHTDLPYIESPRMCFRIRKHTVVNCAKLFFSSCLRRIAASIKRQRYYTHGPLRGWGMGVGSGGWGAKPRKEARSKTHKKLKERFLIRRKRKRMTQSVTRLVSDNASKKCSKHKQSCSDEAQSAHNVSFGLKIHTHWHRIPSTQLQPWSTNGVLCGLCYSQRSYE